MLFKSIQLTNFLSFGPQSEEIELRPLNILIGANGSGKSNFLEAFSLIQAMPSESGPHRRISEGGGINEWVYKGTGGDGVALIAPTVHSKADQTLLHHMFFSETAQSFSLQAEFINVVSRVFDTEGLIYEFKKLMNGTIVIRRSGGLVKSTISEPNSSILSQLQDSVVYPEITFLGQVYKKIRIYREWSFGRSSTLRKAQKPDQPGIWLEPDLSNLGVFLSRLQSDLKTKKKLKEFIGNIYGGVEDFNIQLAGGYAEIVFQENEFTTPATRLSDGTLKFLCLLAILLDPSPPPLICIDEPELGLHPDLIIELADLLRDASTRTQLIITTHSETLIDCFSDQPEVVMVCDRDQNGTHIKRLDANELEPWLAEYTLGRLWSKGRFGGNRW